MNKEPFAFNLQNSHLEEDEPKEISQENQKIYSSFLEGNIDLKNVLSEEEKKIYKAYKADIYKQAEERLGKNEYSYDVISRAARLCKLISLNAPEIVVGKERNTLIAAMLMYRFGKSLTKIQGVTSEGE